MDTYLFCSNEVRRSHLCSVKYLWSTKQKEKIIIQKVVYGHRLTQINLAQMEITNF
jgi:hypothetical protein